MAPCIKQSGNSTKFSHWTTLNVFWTCFIVHVSSSIQVRTAGNDFTIAALSVLKFFNTPRKFFHQFRRTSHNIWKQINRMQKMCQVKPRFNVSILLEFPLSEKEGDNCTWRKTICFWCTSAETEKGHSGIIFRCYLRARYHVYPWLPTLIQ